jgi:hypothetical protein
MESEEPAMGVPGGRGFQAEKINRGGSKFGMFKKHVIPDHVGFHWL